jgi:tetratricopeptide (TPR) repeat protein
MYAGDFETAEGEAQAVLEEFPSYELVLVCVALSQLGQERISDAAATYQRLQGVSTRGVSIAASGLADLALYQGRLENAVQILEKGIALDDAVGILQQGLTGSPAATTAARKAAALGEAHLARGQLEPALAAAQQAVTLSREENVLFLAARLYLEAEREDQALQLASELSTGLQPEPQAYAKLIEGGVELKRGRVQEAIRLLREAQNLSDTWLGRLELGRAYVEVGAYTEAYSELEAALNRRGEATAVFLDDIPTYRYLPAVYYYLGRSQEGLNSPAATESYQTFLDIKENSDQDPLVTDARKRLETR